MSTDSLTGRQSPPTKSTSPSPLGPHRIQRTSSILSGCGISPASKTCFPRPQQRPDLHRRPTWRVSRSVRRIPVDLSLLSFASRTFAPQQFHPTFALADLVAHTVDSATAASGNSVRIRRSRAKYTRTTRRRDAPKSVRPSDRLAAAEAIWRTARHRAPSRHDTTQFVANKLHALRDRGSAAPDNISKELAEFAGHNRELVK
jgi:hypothetical protein